MIVDVGGAALGESGVDPGHEVGGRGLELGAEGAHAHGLAHLVQERERVAAHHACCAVFFEVVKCYQGR